MPPRVWSFQLYFSQHCTRASHRMSPLSAFLPAWGWAPDGERFAIRLFVTDSAPAPASPAARDSSTAPVQLIARPERTALYDSTASDTSIALFAHCPRRYYLERYLGWQSGRARVVTTE